MSEESRVYTAKDAGEKAKQEQEDILSEVEGKMFTMPEVMIQPGEILIRKDSPLLNTGIVKVGEYVRNRFNDRQRVVAIRNNGNTIHTYCDRRKKAFVYPSRELTVSK